MTVTEIPLRMEPVTQDTFLSGTPTAWDTPAESISAAPRSRRSSSTSAATSLGQSRRPTPTTGGPAGRSGGDRRRAHATRPPRRASRPRRSPGIGIGSPGKVDDAAGTVSARQEPARLGRQLQPARRRSRRRCGTPVSLGNDVQVATDAEFELGAGRPYDSLLGVFWGTGVGGGIVLDGKPWIGRDAAGEIGHVVVRIDGALCPLRPPRLHGGLRGPRRDGGPRAPARRPRREDRAVQDHGGARPRRG